LRSAAFAHRISDRDCEREETLDHRDTALERDQGSPIVSVRGRSFDASVVVSNDRELVASGRRRLEQMQSSRERGQLERPIGLAVPVSS